jgi:hypothetical protein
VAELYFRVGALAEEDMGAVSGVCAQALPKVSVETAAISKVVWIFIGAET